jgi:8-oxo-dGTP pyrophosphatase MutT (NUDIX family)
MVSSVFVTTQDNEFFYYKLISAKCFGTIPLYYDIDTHQIFTVFVKNGKKLSFPKGTRELNEHPLFCAVRETKEECGLELGKDYKFMKTVNVYNDFYKDVYPATQYFPTIVFHKATLVCEDDDEIIGCQWYNRDDVMNLTENDICDVRKHLALTAMDEFMKYHSKTNLVKRNRLTK